MKVFRVRHDLVAEKLQKKKKQGFLCVMCPLDEAMATHSSILAWRISWAEEPTVGYSP